MSGPGPAARGPATGPGRLRRAVTALATALLAVAWTADARGQEVRFTPRKGQPAEGRLAEFLERGSYRLMSRDTLLAAGDTVAADVLVLDATVRSSGHLDGDVFVVGGDLFLRPGATVGGAVTAISGGYYPSGDARVADGVTNRPNLRLRVVPREGGWEIFHPREEAERLEPHGLSGFHAPVYRRVDGWTFAWGATVRATGAPGQPSLDGVVRVHTHGSQALEGRLTASARPTGGLRVSATAERRTRTLEGWIRGDLANTTSYFLGAGDLRNYYRSERAELALAATARQGWVPSVSVQWEDARSLRARPLAVLFADDSDVRPNPAVEGGRITSLTAELAYRRRTETGRLAGRVRAEAADSGVAGDHTFVLAEGSLAWREKMPRDHRLEVKGLVRWDAAGRLPPRRWSALGGPGSLPALGTLALRGPRLAFLSTTWLIPVEPLRLPVLGVPRVFVRNAAGAAWAADRSFALEDNAIVGVRFLFLEAGLALDAVRGDLEPELSIGGEFPGRFWD